MCLPFPADLDLRKVCRALGRVKAKWFVIGVQLGIPHDKLEEFKEERDPLSAVVAFWLNGNVADIPISWKTIVEALKSIHVGEPGLAGEISQQYCPREDTTKVEGQTHKLEYHMHEIA